MYAHVIACTGWTWEYIDDHLTIPRLMEMLAYWKDNPPVHVMVAAYFGLYKNKSKAKQMSEAEIQALMAAFPQTAPTK